jgi:hypothetical protein
MPMLVTALIVFAIAAVGGLTLSFGFVLRGRLAPWALSLLHASLGAAGLLLLLYTAVSSGLSGAALAALVILVIAALGGSISPQYICGTRSRRDRRFSFMRASR